MNATPNISSDIRDYRIQRVPRTPREMAQDLRIYVDRLTTFHWHEVDVRTLRTDLDGFDEVLERLTVCSSDQAHRLRERRDEIMVLLAQVQLMIGVGNVNLYVRDRLQVMVRQMADEMSRISETHYGEAPADAAIDRKKHNGGKKPGRPSLSKKEKQRRREIIVAWEDARGHGLSKDDFCKEHRIIVDELDKYMDWKRKQQIPTG